jgi:uncharacterized protein YraI
MDPKTRTIFRYSFMFFLMTACASAPNTDTSSPISETAPAVKTAAPALAIPSGTFTPAPAPPTETFTPIPPTETATWTAVPVVDSLKAIVTADLLTCRYGPGAEYLYLFAFRKGAQLGLIGQTGGNNWVLVENKPQRCWVNTKYLEIQGDPKALKVMYPDGYKIPVSPYYSSPAVLSAVRDPNDPNKVTVKWTDISLRAGDEEDANMFIYIIEVWHCQGGQMIFDSLASNYPEITFVDEAGCSSPSHGRVYFQEKHGYAGPADIPWPAH